jgi:hypothetical protein
MTATVRTDSWMQAGRARCVAWNYDLRVDWVQPLPVRTLYEMLATCARLDDGAPPDTALTASFETIDNDSSLVCLSLLGYAGNA